MASDKTYHDAAAGRAVDLPELPLGGESLGALAAVCTIKYEVRNKN